MPLASALPWRKILTALPYVVATADKARKALSSRSEPPVDPHADLKTQVDELAKRVHDNEVAQAEQAKLVASIAEQLEAVAERSARTSRVAWAALIVAVIALVLAAIPFFR